MRLEKRGCRPCISTLHPVMQRKTQPGKNVSPSRPTREKFKIFQTKCWSFGEDECIQGDVSQDGCLGLMDPELLLGEEPECKMAFVATVGTVLHHPCSCHGVHNDHVLTCNWIHDVLHNRSLFSEYGLNLVNALKKNKTFHLWTETHSAHFTVSHLYSSDALAEQQWTLETSENGRIWTKSVMAPHKISRCCWSFCCSYSFSFFFISSSVCGAPWMTLNCFERCYINNIWIDWLIERRGDLMVSQDHISTYLSFSDYLLYAFATVLLVGVAVLMPLALVCKIWWGNWRQKEYQSTSLLLVGNCGAFLLTGWWKEEMKKCFIHWRKATVLLFSDGPWWNVWKLCSHGEIPRDACYACDDVKCSASFELPAKHNFTDIMFSLATSGTGTRLVFVLALDVSHLRGSSTNCLVSYIQWLIL